MYIYIVRVKLLTKHTVKLEKNLCQKRKKKVLIKLGNVLVLEIPNTGCKAIGLKSEKLNVLHWDILDK